MYFVEISKLLLSLHKISNIKLLQKVQWISKSKSVLTLGINAILAHIILWFPIEISARDCKVFPIMHSYHTWKTSNDS